MYDLPREDWEVDPYKVADWTNSPPVDWSIVDNITIHYPGVPNRPSDPSLDWFRDRLRSSQQWYCTRTSGGNYSLGYNEMVTQNGMAGQIRGEQFACAANGNWTTNRVSYAIQIAVAGDDAAHPAAVARVRERIAWAQARAGRQLDVKGHREHKDTSCPGEGIWAQIEDGVFDVPYPPPTPGEIVATEHHIKNPPTRIYDTRVGDAVPFTNETRTIHVPSPPDAVAATVTITAAGMLANGHATAWADGPRPNVSCLNFSTIHGAIGNTTTVPLDNGAFSLHVTGIADIIVDLVGVWT